MRTDRKWFTLARIWSAVAIIWGLWLIVIVLHAANVL